MILSFLNTSKKSENVSMMLKGYVRHRKLLRKDKIALSNISWKKNRKSLKNVVSHQKLIKNQRSESRKIRHRIDPKIIMNMR